MRREEKGAEGESGEDEGENVGKRSRGVVDDVKLRAEEDEKPIRSGSSVDVCDG